jgi:hypothetical protein
MCRLGRGGSVLGWLLPRCCFWGCFWCWIVFIEQSFDSIVILIQHKQSNQLQTKPTINPTFNSPIIHPRTMMIHPRHTPITNPTMMTHQRFKRLTLPAHTVTGTLPDRWVRF